MNRRRRILSAVLALLLAVSGCAGGAPDAVPPPASEPQEQAEDSSVSAAPVTPAAQALSEREKAWVEDIEFLRDACKTRHMDPFTLCSEEEFDRNLDRLTAQVGALSDEDLVCEIICAVAQLGDIHSHATPPASFYAEMFPVSVRYFGDGLYLTAYRSGYEKFAPHLLREIVAVNGVDIAYLTKKAASLGNPFNTWFSRENFRKYFFVPAFLTGRNVTAGTAIRSGCWTATGRLKP